MKNTNNSSIITTADRLIACTHAGPGHMDDFLAACILIANGYEVIRCAADDAPIGSVVFDMGGGELDHHQLPDAGDGKCSLHLVADYLGVTLVGPWADHVGIIDCGKSERRTPLNPAGVVSNPMIRWFLDQWSKAHSVSMLDAQSFEMGSIGHVLSAAMLDIGNQIIEAGDVVDHAIYEIDGRPKLHFIQFDAVDARGIKSMDATAIIGQRTYVDFIVCDGRDSGTFNILKKGDREIPKLDNEIFRHPSGFMVVTRGLPDADDGWRQCQECGGRVNIFGGQPCCGQVCTC